MNPLSVRAPLQAVLLQWCTEPGHEVKAGELLAILEAMKMEHEVRAPSNARVHHLAFRPGELVAEGDVLLTLLAQEIEKPGASAVQSTADAPKNPQTTASTEGGFSPGSEDGVRSDLRRVWDRHIYLEDAQRPEAMARRHALGLRSGRENVGDLCDPGSFHEYGALAVAAQSGRRSQADLIANTPADGVITGLGTINSALFPAEQSRCAVMAYDPTVLAGTQGKRGHQKAVRLLEVALRHRLPLVLFAEGGGGRPGDDDIQVVAGLNMATFSSFARLHGRVPLVGIAAGRCFAGNASLLGCCDAVIATKGCNIGMGGPTMVEGGGLGFFKAEQIGPAEVHHTNGVIDLLANDESHAVRLAKHYLSFFQGQLTSWQAPDTALLRDVVPKNRMRAYDSLDALNALVDLDSLLLLRTGFGKSIHTALGRMEGKPIGFMVSNPLHLGGAIDADAADKAARFMRSCDHWGLPLISLVDTPGFMVGPEIEKQAQVRHTSRMFLAAAHLRVPFLGVVLRKGYGLGAMAMTAGGFHSPSAMLSWPTGEFGGMGLEGYVRLGYKRELECLPEGPQREALFRRLVDERYEAGSAMNMAAHLEIDAVIDPAETRERLLTLLRTPSVEALKPRESGMVDVW